MKNRLFNGNAQRSALLLLTGVALWTLPMARIGVADPAKVGPTTPTLEAVPDIYDFGRRALEDTSLITHTFVLTSHAKTPITVDQLEPSCHCTSAVFEQETDQSGPVTIQPEHTVKVDMTVNPSDMASGDVEKEVFVFVNGESIPRVTLEIKGTILPPDASPPTEHNAKTK